MDHKTSRRQSGLGLVENLISAVIATTAIAAAAPGFERTLQLQRLESAAALLETDLQHARSLAVTQNRALRFEMRSGTTGACYVVHAGRPGDCLCEDRPAATCSNSTAPLRSEAFSGQGRLGIRATAASFIFDPTLGTVTPTSSIDISNRRGDTLRLVVNVMGRVRTCTPSGLLPTHPAC